MRFLGNRQKPHARLVWRSVALFVVALYARTRKVLPRVCTTPRPRNNVVYSEWWRTAATVLTAITVSAKYVLARQFDFLERNP